MISGVGVSRTAEEVLDLIMNREEALGLTGRPEALHNALASSGGLMAVLGSIVQAPMLPMLDTRHDLSLGRLRVAAALDQNIEHDPMLIDRAPEPMPLAGDADHDLVEMPFVPGCRKAPTDLGCKILAELQRPLPHGLMADQMPRAASISSTMRRLRGNRKYSHTAWLMTSAGKRWRT
jgi:hypothetical protein